MDLLKQLGLLVEQATSGSNEQPPLDIYEKVLEVIQRRVDMPKHTINAVSKRLIFKQKQVLYNCFDLLQFLSFRCEQSLYNQICTKEFLLKVSGLLMNKELHEDVHTKILATIKVWEELFRPYQDLLPMYFQFYAGLLRKQFPINNKYVSPHRPQGFQVRKPPRREEPDQPQKVRKQPVKPTATEQKTFEQIRNKLLLTNEIIDNINPSEGVAGNDILLEMMDEVKKSEKTIQETINGNPTQNIMELAIAVNDDIHITNRRFKALQKNRKPQPFILTELASDMIKEQERQEQIKIEKTIKASQSKTREEKPAAKVESKKQEIDIFDVACEPKQEQPVVGISDNLMDLNLNSEQPKPQPQLEGGNIFDLLGSQIQNNPGVLEAVGQQSQFQPGMGSSINPSVPIGVTLSTDLTKDSAGQNPPVQYAGQLNNPNSFQSDNFATENDLKKQEKSAWDHLTDLSEFIKK